jgi:16S rRNA processing protein RimM
MPETAGSASAVAAPALLRVAHVRRVHGVRGEVRVQSLGGDVGRFPPGTALVSERGRLPLTIATSRALDGDELLLSFEELTEREQVATLTGDYLSVDPAHARPLPDGEWFVWQLVGLRVVSDAGDELGVVRDVEPQPAGDVIVATSDAGERRFPMVREWVKSVDLVAGVVVVTPWPEDDD